MTAEHSSRVEQHGADPVPQSERTNGAWDYFVILAGLNIALPTFLLGGLVVPGLSWRAALGALAFGNVLVGVLLALTGSVGVRYGLPAAVASRFALGHPRGSWLASVCILVSVMGWFAITAEVAGLAVDRLQSGITGVSAPVTMIVLVACTNAIPAILGIGSIKWLSQLSIPLLLGLCAWMLIAIARAHSLTSLLQYSPTGEVQFSEAVDWTVGGLIVGIFIASDISRYVRNQLANWMGAFVGNLPIVCFLCVIGALSKLATGNWNPVDSVERLGLGVPALLIILFSTWTTNDLNLYSAGLSLTNLAPGRSRWINTLVLTAFGTTLAALRIAQHFSTAMELFNVVFGPLVGIALADYFVLRRGILRVEDAYIRRGPLHYLAGVNPVAWGVLALGIAVGAMLPPWLMRSVISIILSGVLYYAGMSACARWAPRLIGRPFGVGPGAPERPTVTAM